MPRTLNNTTIIATADGLRAIFGDGGVLNADGVSIIEVDRPPTIDEVDLWLQDGVIRHANLRVGDEGACNG